MNTKQNYSDLLKDPRWQKKRLEIFNRDKFACKLCKDKETTLHIHHLKYNVFPWESKNTDLITLCKHCHDEISMINNKDIDLKSLRLVKVNITGGDNNYIIIYILNNQLYFRTYYNGECVSFICYSKDDIATKSIKDIFNYFLKNNKNG